MTPRWWSRAWAPVHDVGVHDGRTYGELLASNSLLIRQLAQVQRDAARWRRDAEHWQQTAVGRLDTVAGMEREADALRSIIADLGRRLDAARVGPCGDTVPLPRVCDEADLRWPNHPGNRPAPGCAPASGPM